MAKYVGTEGELILGNKADEMIEKHRQLAEQDTTKHFVKAEFFGLETFKDLLSECEGKAVGFRIYYGLSDESHAEHADRKIKANEKVKPTPRLIIVPVDTHGSELIPNNGLNRDVIVNRAMSAQKVALGKGPLCPSEC